MKRRSILRLGLVALALGAGSHAGPVWAQQSAASDRLKIRLALSGGVADGLGYRIAKSLGYVEAENLAVEEQHVESRTLARDAVANGQVDITNTGLTTSLRAIEYGQPVRLVAGITGTNPIYIVVSKQFLQKHQLSRESFQALSPQQRAKLLLDKKARFASSIPGSLTDFVSQSQLKFLGVDPQNDISIYYFPNPANSVDGFSQGQNTDVVAISENNVARLSRLLGVAEITELPLVLTLDEQAKLIPTSLVPGENWIANVKTVNQAALVRFLRAYLRGVAFLQSRPAAETTSLLLKDNPDIVSERAKTAMEDQVKFFIRTTASNGKLTEQQIAAAIAFSKAQGQIKGSLDPAQVVDNTFVEAAAKGLNAAN